MKIAFGETAVLAYTRDMKYPLSLFVLLLLTGTPGPVLAAASAEAPYQVAVKGDRGPLDVGDERPVGEMGIMRGKRNEFALRSYKSKPNRWLDLAIIVDGALLFGLVVYVFASRRARG